MKNVLEDIVNASHAIVFVWKEEDRWPVEFVSKNISLFDYTPDDFMSVWHFRKQANKPKPSL
jgi:hypothetical protein